jgi:hypothetical protein
MRLLLERNHTVRSAGQYLGLSRNQTDYIAIRFNLNAKPEVLERAKERAGLAGARKSPMTKPGRPAVGNSR